VIALLEQFRTIPIYDRGEAPRDLTELYGANMAVRRAALLEVRGFDERLGPGVGTAGEDIDLATRILRHGGRIGYMPQAIVYHEVDMSRLTPEYLVDFQLRLGRSELVLYPGRSHWHALPRLLNAVVTYGWSRAIGAQKRSMHAWGRVVRHADLFRARWRSRHRAV
jgi:GT2 family glycosyltransferase